MTKKVAAQSPLPKTKKELQVVADKEEAGYEFVLRFNSRAELYDVAMPGNLTMEQTSEHLAVAQLWLAHEIVAKGGKK